MEESFAVVTNDDSTPIKNEYLCFEKKFTEMFGNGTSRWMRMITRMQGCC
jgi:hypothetical protein